MAPTTAAVPAAAAERPFPTKLDELGSAAPATVPIYFHAPGTTALLGSLGGTAAELPEIVEGMVAAGGKFPLSNAEVTTLLGSLTEAAFFGDPRSKGEPEIGGLLRFDNPAAVESALKQLGFESSEPRRFRATFGKRTIHLGWVRELGLVVISPRETMVDASFDALTGARPSLASTAGYPKGKKDLWLSVDLDAFDPDEFLDKGSLAVATVPLQGPGRLDVDLLGPRVPRLGNVLGPSKFALAQRLPMGSASVMGLSLARTKGKTLRDLIAELARVSDKGAFAGPVAEAVLRSNAKVSLDELDKALEGEIVAASYIDVAAMKKGRGVKGPRDPLAGITAVSLVALRDVELAKKALAGLGTTLTAEVPGTVTGPGTITSPLKSGVFKAQIKGDTLIWGIGDKAVLTKQLANVDKKGSTLASDAAFTKSRSAGRPESLSFFYVDFAPLGALDPSLGSEMEKLGGLKTFVDLTVAASETGLDATFEADGAAQLIGMMTSLAVHGVNRYLESVKVVEAKNTIGAIARGAVASYERELATPSGKVEHRLCAAANAVPQTIPKGTTYQPSTKAGEDFELGDTRTGWRCLRFVMTSPIRYQYEYRVGSGYKGPARGGPNPGPKGFEVSAEGDLDGDGKTSLFTMTGKVTPQGVTLAPEIFVSDEFE
ncbi:MAG: hypothetical protein HOV80_25685 [Polyangiaceae bacterium]|nr:hypothetical protein [Polyangiaceae bacterium]